MGDTGRQLPHGFHLLRLANPFLKFGLFGSGTVTEQSNFYSRVELAFFEGFEKIAEGLCSSCRRQRRFVGVSRQIDDGNLVVGADAFCCIDTVHVTLKLDVHQNEIRAQPFGTGNGVLCRGHDRRNVIPHRLELALDIEANNALVLDDKNACRRTH